MNATGHVQSKWRLKYVNVAREPLRSYFSELQKNEINLLYLHFILHRFSSLFVNFLFKSCQ